MSPPDPPKREIQDLPARYMEAGGQTAMAWATFQWMVDEAVMVLAQVDLTLGAAIMTNLSAMPAKFASLLNLATLRKCPDELLQELNKFVGRANEVSGHRNRVVHGVLIISYETKTILRREPKFRKGSQPMPQTTVAGRNCTISFTRSEILRPIFLRYLNGLKWRYPLIMLNDGAALTPLQQVGEASPQIKPPPLCRSAPPCLRPAIARIPPIARAQRGALPAGRRGCRFSPYPGANDR
jgi:hypothetical protein